MKERGILEYVEAAKRLHSDRVFFDIMGYCDEDYEELLDDLEKEGVIRQIGFHTQVHEYLAAARISWSVSPAPSGSTARPLPYPDFRPRQSAILRSSESPMPLSPQPPPPAEP